MGKTVLLDSMVLVVPEEAEKGHSAEQAEPVVLVRRRLFRPLASQADMTELEKTHKIRRT